MKRIISDFYKNIISVAILLLLILPFSCVDPIVPEFDFKDNILFIDAFALSKEKLSSVTLKRSSVINGSYSILSIDNATVQFENVSSGEIIPCDLVSNGLYLPPVDFKVNEGETWKLKLELEDGSKYESKPEYINPAITIDNIRLR